MAKQKGPGAHGYMKRNRKRDANEPEIIAALEDVPGVTVITLDKPVDLLVGYQGKTFLLEVKNPKGKNRMTQEQAEFFDDWTGGAAIVVRTPDDALDAIGFGVSPLAVARVPMGTQ